MYTLKVRKIGTSKGVILPKELLDNHALNEGDKFHLLQTERGDVMVSYDPTIEKDLEILEQAERKYHNALRELSV